MVNLHWEKRPKAKAGKLKKEKQTDQSWVCGHTLAAQDRKD